MGERPRPAETQVMPMPLTQLPTPRPLSLATPDDWAAWEATPSPYRSHMATAAFWAAMPPLTVPQELAIRLHRPTAHVSIRAISRRYTALKREARTGRFVCEPLRRYTHLWTRSHTARLFRVRPTRGIGILAPDNPIRHLLGWAQGGEIFEDRWLVAAADPQLPLAVRVERVYDLLRRAARAGYIERCGEVRVPADQWCLSAREARAWDVRPPAFSRARAHEACAVEAAILLATVRDRGAPVVALRSGAELASRARRAAGRRLQRGDRIKAAADLEVEDLGGYRTQVEVLSSSYTDADLAAKYAELSVSVTFVATSRSIAARAARASPGAHCWYF